MKSKEKKAIDKELKILSKIINLLKFDFAEDGAQMTTICTIEYGEIKYIGRATCAHSDKDFYSPKVGAFIARERAIIALLHDLTENQQIIQMRESKLQDYIQTHDKIIKSIKLQRKREKQGLDPLPPLFIDLDKNK